MQYLAADVDEVGRPVEESARRLERWAERLNAEAGDDVVSVNHLPLEVPSSAKATRVGTWPGTDMPMVVVTFWRTPAED